MMRTLFVDFESYYDTKIGYTLAKTAKFPRLSMTEYIRSPLFQVHGMGFMYSDEKSPQWADGAQGIRDFVSTVDWATTILCAHNVKFDGAILAWHFNVRPYQYIDTQSLSQAVLGGKVRGHSLKVVAEYFNLPPKGEMRTDGIREPRGQEREALMDYCKRDVEICAQIHDILAEQFPASERVALDWTVRAFIDPVLELAPNVLHEVIIDEKEKKATLFDRAGADKSTFSSAAKFSKLLLAEGVEIPTKKSPRTGNSIPALAKSDTAFTALLEHPSERVKLLVEARLEAKSTLEETRSESLLRVANTGPFPFDVKYSGADQTHRYSGGSGAGGNPQNFPRDSRIREAIQAPPGHVLVVADFSAVELRVLAWLAQEPKLCATLSNPKGDVYVEFASKVYGRPITKADGPERKFGKEGVLGLGYGMGASKFALRVLTVLHKTIDEDEALRTVGLYRGTYAGVPKFWQNVETLIPSLTGAHPPRTLPGLGNVLFRKEEIVLPSGLAMKYPGLRWVVGLKKKGHFRDGWAYDKYIRANNTELVGLYGGKITENLCQGLAGELCKLAINRARQMGLLVVGQVHDEIIIVAKESEAEAALQALRRAMEDSVPWWPAVRLFSECGYAKNWKGAKPK